VNGIETVNAKEIAIEMIVKRNAITVTVAGPGVATEAPAGTRIVVGVVKEGAAMIVAETDHVFFLTSLIFRHRGSVKCIRIVFTESNLC
jgi:hypothetical protein